MMNVPLSIAISTKRMSSRDAIRCASMGPLLTCLTSDDFMTLSVHTVRVLRFRWRSWAQLKECRGDKTLLEFFIAGVVLAATILARRLPASCGEVAGPAETPVSAGNREILGG
jgi:hypothetical protein